MYVHGKKNRYSGHAMLVLFMPMPSQYPQAFVLIKEYIVFFFAFASCKSSCIIKCRPVHTLRIFKGFCFCSLVNVNPLDLKLALIETST